jgi:hypothetical protein
MTSEYVIIKEAWDLSDTQNSAMVMIYERPDGVAVVLDMYVGIAPFVFMDEKPTELVYRHRIPRHEADTRWPDRDQGAS